MRGFAAVMALALAAAPVAVMAQGLPTGEGRCIRDRNRPNDETLYCVWGTGYAIFPCDGGTTCSEEDAPCYADQNCDGCAWFVRCE